MLELIGSQFFFMFQNVEVEEERVDQRSVDDLLTFINGGNGGMIQKSLLVVLIVNCLPLFLNNEF